MTNAKTLTLNQLFALYAKVERQCKKATDFDSPCFEELAYLEEEIKARLAK